MIPTKAMTNSSTDQVGTSARRGAGSKASDSHEGDDEFVNGSGGNFGERGAGSKAHDSHEDDDEFVNGSGGNFGEARRREQGP